MLRQNRPQATAQRDSWQAAAQEHGRELAIMEQKQKKTTKPYSPRSATVRCGCF